MIRDFDSSEQALNSFILAAQDWIRDGMPAINPWFRGDRSLCTTLDYYVNVDAELPYYVLTFLGEPFNKEESLAVRKIRHLMTKSFIDQELDSVFPFNDHSGDSYAVELETGTVWDNKERIDFVMNFKFLEEPNNEKQ